VPFWLGEIAILVSNGDNSEAIIPLAPGTCREGGKYFVGLVELLPPVCIRD